jgi:hypothetical protein
VEWERQRTLTHLRGELRGLILGLMYVHRLGVGATPAIFRFLLSTMGHTAVELLFASLVAVVAQITAFTEIGCFVDIDSSANYARVLPVFFCSNGLDAGPQWPACAAQTNSKQPGLVQGYAGYYNMTQELCNTLCVGYTYFGVEDGGECYCGNDMPNQGAAPNCNKPCTGDPEEQCGSGNSILVFNVESMPLPDPIMYKCVDNTCVPTRTSVGIDANTCRKVCGNATV